MAKFAVAVNYSYKQYDEEVLTIRAASADEITQEMVEEALRLKHSSLDSDMEIEDWGVDE